MSRFNLKNKIRKLAFKTTYDFGVGAVLLGVGSLLFSGGSVALSIISIVAGGAMIVISGLAEDEPP